MAQSPASCVFTISSAGLFFMKMWVKTSSKALKPDFPIFRAPSVLVRAASRDCSRSARRVVAALLGGISPQILLDGRPGNRLEAVRFTAHSSISSMARLVVQPGSPAAWEIQLKAGKNSFGRGPDNDVALDDPSVSGTHCQVVVEGGQFVIIDLGSTNGTFVNRT